MVIVSLLMVLRVFTTTTQAAGHAAMPRPYGRRVMDLWDALCTLLRVYEISVEDVSSKVRSASI